MKNTQGLAAVVLAGTMMLAGCKENNTNNLQYAFEGTIDEEKVSFICSQDDFIGPYKIYRNSLLVVKKDGTEISYMDHHKNDLLIERISIKPEKNYETYSYDKPEDKTVMDLAQKSFSDYLAKIKVVKKEKQATVENYFK
jgi:hypothetical protein